MQRPVPLHQPGSEGQPPGHARSAGKCQVRNSLQQPASSCQRSGQAKQGTGQDRAALQQQATCSICPPAMEYACTHQTSSAHVRAVCTQSCSSLACSTRDVAATARLAGIEQAAFGLTAHHCRQPKMGHIPPKPSPSCLLSEGSLGATFTPSNPKTAHLWRCTRLPDPDVSSIGDACDVAAIIGHARVPQLALEADACGVVRAIKGKGGPPLGEGLGHSGVCYVGVGCGCVYSEDTVVLQGEPCRCCSVLTLHFGLVRHWASQDARCRCHWCSQCEVQLSQGPVLESAGACILT